MFYKLIERKRDEWLSSKDCVATDLVSYMERQGRLRDAQIDSIKTYLYLKIECENRPLWELFSSGKFNSIDVDSLEVNRATREVLQSNPAALALWKYASIHDEKGNVNSPKIITEIRSMPDSLDYQKIIKELFFNVGYPDYLFSIPMGAGKTYLMAPSKSNLVRNPNARKISMYTANPDLTGLAAETNLDSPLSKPLPAQLMSAEHGAPDQLPLSEGGGGCQEGDCTYMAQ